MSTGPALKATGVHNVFESNTIEYQSTTTITAAPIIFNNTAEHGLRGA